MPLETTCGIFIPDHKSSPEPLEWEHSLQDPRYQRTNSSGYQIVRTQTKESTGIQDPASPNHQ